MQKLEKNFLREKKSNLMSTIGNSTNIFWHECPVGKFERQKLLQQRGCVVWITGLSGSATTMLLTRILLLSWLTLPTTPATNVIRSLTAFSNTMGELYARLSLRLQPLWVGYPDDRTAGQPHLPPLDLAAPSGVQGKSTLACSLGREIHSKGKLSYILDGDNLRHGLTKDLGFKAEDRAENIRRVGEVAKLFADAGLICIASLISPYRRERDACRGLLSDASFIEARLSLDSFNCVCEKRDAKGLYKLARAGKIKGFTGIDDPYEPPLNPESLLIDAPNTVAEVARKST
ncbi:hypothetical protein GIB67_021493 [Kingdonia uniflora]|uniref:Adenylyl-sulfate kinase n=1 Tax=Kingdonia uniflora TaxID=39325 RepID=A0A7J7L9K5_9MAGN|nr:hypothetical protein GIB67_021493 [Kingdonia uniflora]